jgi:hypothetical protein
MFNREVASDLGGRDAEPERPGLPGRGFVLALKQSGHRTATADPAGAEYALRLEVRLDDRPPFVATVVARLTEGEAGGISPGETVLAVRVDPDGTGRVVLDLACEPPDVRVVAEPGQRTAAEILETGERCEVVVRQATRLGLRSPEDVDLYGFVLSVGVGDLAPYRVKVGMPVPPAAVPFLYPGSRLPACHLPGGHREDVVVDWAAALGQRGAQQAVVVDWEEARRATSDGSERAASG